MESFNLKNSSLSLVLGLFCFHLYISQSGTEGPAKESAFRGIASDKYSCNRVESSSDLDKLSQESPNTCYFFEESEDRGESKIVSAQLKLRGVSLTKQVEIVSQDPEIFKEDRRKLYVSLIDQVYEKQPELLSEEFIEALQSQAASVEGEASSSAAVDAPDEREEAELAEEPKEELEDLLDRYASVKNSQCYFAEGALNKGSRMARYIERRKDKDISDETLKKAFERKVRDLSALLDEMESEEGTHRLNRLQQIECHSKLALKISDSHHAAGKQAYFIQHIQPLVREELMTAGSIDSSSLSALASTQPMIKMQISEDLTGFNFAQRYNQQSMAILQKQEMLQGAPKTHPERPKLEAEIKALEEQREALVTEYKNRPLNAAYSTSQQFWASQLVSSEGFGTPADVAAVDSGNAGTTLPQGDAGTAVVSATDGTGTSSVDPFDKLLDRLTTLRLDLTSSVERPGESARLDRVSSTGVPGSTFDLHQSASIQ